MVLPRKDQIFRLRKCPVDIDDSKALENLLGSTLDGITPGDVHVQSLATEFNVRDPRKTATLWFTILPTVVTDSPDKTEWSIDLEPNGEFDNSTRRSGRLLLDTHFHGFTPLVDVEPSHHEFDCLVISGLASHPYGSWKSKESARYMWVRDALPEQLPHVRPILYGYDTTLSQSTSFQSIADVAGGLIDHLMPPGWSTTQMKPLVFLAHSLGGLVLKQAILALADTSIRGQSLLELVRGGIMFGVPHRGMAQKQLLTMVKGQPNEELVKELAIGSQYLKTLDDRFSNVLMMRMIVFNFAYETKTSPTVMQHDNGSFSRNGPHEVLVDQPSATRGLDGPGSSQETIFAIDRDHSGMVKFEDGSFVCENVLKRLEHICASTIPQHTPPSAGAQTSNRVPLHTAEVGEKEVRRWSLEDVRKALYLPSLDNRYHGVEESSAHTCEWVFGSSYNLGSWIKNDVSGLFWINGKPGSGKSTLMKFIEDHERTQASLRDLRLRSNRKIIRVRHFLHLRGSSDENSFIGLLHSIVLQILEEVPNLIRLISPILEATSLRYASTLTEQDLLDCLELILQQSEDDILIFLLLDALDEFSGSTDFISKFLNQHLLAMSGPRTHVKILFSSRPWDVFLLEFASIPTMKLQEHNGPDIEQYCLNRISGMQLEEPGREEPARFALHELVPAISTKAEGVFVWVRLTMNALLDHTQAGDSDLAQLPGILEAIPSDLNEFYASIIRRIPHEDRLDAYVIFQMALALQEDEHHGIVNVLTLIYILACHQCPTYRESKEKFEEIDKLLFSDTLKTRVSRSDFMAKVREVSDLHLDVLGFPAQWRLPNPSGRLQDFGAIYQYIQKINRCCGGLVEATATNPPDNSSRERTNVYSGVITAAWDLDRFGFKLQLLHQTVLDFIKGSTFNHLLLQERAHMVQANRYVYLAKLLFTTSRSFATNPSHDGPLELLGALCVDAENSIGHSLSEFIDSVPAARFQELGVSGPISFALKTDLILYLRDHSSALQTMVDKPLLALIGRGDRIHGMDFMGELLVNRMLGIRLIYELTTDADRTEALQQLLLGICELLSAGTVTNVLDAGNYRGHDAIRQARLFFELGSNPEMLVYGKGRYSGRFIPKGEVFWRWPARAEFLQHLQRDMWWRPVHSVPANLTRTLLEHGANVDGEDIDGNTALDWLLAEFDVKGGAMSRGLLGDDLLSHWRQKDKGGVNTFNLRTLSFWRSYVSFRDSWQKMMILILRGGTSKTTGMKAWQQFFAWIRRHRETAEPDDRRISPGTWFNPTKSPIEKWFYPALRDLEFDLESIERYVSTLGLPQDSIPARRLV